MVWKSGEGKWKQGTACKADKIDYFSIRFVVGVFGRYAAGAFKCYKTAQRCDKVEKLLILVCVNLTVNKNLKK